MTFFSFFNRSRAVASLPVLQRDASQGRDPQFEAKRRSVFMQMRYMRKRSRVARLTKVSNIWKNTLILAEPKDWLRMIAAFLCAGLLAGYVGSLLLSRLHHETEVASTKHPLKPMPPTILLPLTIEPSEGVQLQFTRSLSQPTN